MSKEKIVLIIGLALSVIIALIDVKYAGLALVATGLVYGVIGVEESDRTFFFITAIALATAVGSLAGIPEVGKFLTEILSNVSSFLNSAVIAVFVMLMVEKIQD